MKHRLDRVKELIKRELGDLIGRELTFNQLVTIQSVDITPDLRNAHIFVSVLGGDPDDIKSALAKLHHHRKELQALLSKRVILKYTPHLHFKLDIAVERGTRVISILESLDLPPVPEGSYPGMEDEDESRDEDDEDEDDFDDEDDLEDEEDDSGDEDEDDFDDDDEDEDEDEDEDRRG